MRIETRLITDYRGDVIEAVAILHQNGTSMVIADVHCNIINEEPVERLLARALRKAAEWMEAGEVNLTAIKGGWRLSIRPDQATFARPALGAGLEEPKNGTDRLPTVQEDAGRR